MGLNEALGSFNSNSNGSAVEANGVQDLQLRRSGGSLFSSELFSALFPKSKSGKVKDHREGDTVLLMGSLPSTSL